MPDYTRLITMHLDLPEQPQHGHALTVEVGYGIEPDQAYAGTVGTFIEKVQSLCMSAFNDGKREAYEELLAKGCILPCPICEKPFHPQMRPIAEDVLMCEECRYA